MKTLIVVSLLLMGCATGIQMTDEEADECKRVGCTVWTQEELQQLGQRIFHQGVLRGLQSRGL